LASRVIIPLGMGTLRSAESIVKSTARGSREYALVESNNSLAKSDPSPPTYGVQSKYDISVFLNNRVAAAAHLAAFRLVEATPQFLRRVSFSSVAQCH
jgi:hypothetical protein